mmetsp:Transcript_22575/g.25174  ORF Transcript_22575/g.25174 Transcript_22575/m.25174 type:complete len:144 (+) Transcript_22575:341-772(+)
MIRTTLAGIKASEIRKQPNRTISTLSGMGSAANSSQSVMICGGYPQTAQAAMDNLRFGMLLGLATPHHNIEIALECLIKLRIMANSADCIGLKVYRIVELICQHIQYEDDDGIEEEPNELLSIGNTKITARKLKLNSSRNKRK